MERIKMPLTVATCVFVIVSLLTPTLTMAKKECVCDPDMIKNYEDPPQRDISRYSREMQNTFDPIELSPLDSEDSLFTTDNIHVRSSPSPISTTVSSENPSVLSTDKLPIYPNYMPEIGNGHIATVIHNEAIFMNGLYNGANITSHRARIPSTAAYMLYGLPPGAHSTFILNMGKGYYTEAHTGGGLDISLTTFVHRVFTGVVVNLLTMSRDDLNKKANVFVHFIKGPPSEDIDLYKDDQGVIVGRTRVAEYPELAPRTIFYMKSSASLKGQHIMSPGKKTQTWASFTVIDVDKQKVLDEYSQAVKAFEDNTLLSSHEKVWENTWKKGRIDVEGNITLARINYAVMYYLQSSLPSNGNRKDWPFIGLSPGGLAHGDKDRDYMGHVFWDQDLWMSPGLALLRSDIGKLLVETRIRTLKSARLLAKRTGYEGARYPWESALTGLEVCPGSAYSDLEIHITGDVVMMMRQYWYLTKDRKTFLEEGAFDIVTGAAEFFASRVFHNKTNDSYRILVVMPPDEYHYPVDDSLYTNAIAKCTLVFANQLARALGKPENSTWKTIADKLVILYDEALDYNPEFEGFRLDDVTKQADVVLLPYPLMYPLKESTRENNLKIYEKTTPVGPAPAMTWSMFLLDWLALGDDAKAAELFQRSILNVQKPFNIWTENSDGKGATNFLTGMGGHLQSLLYGYGGCRLYEDYISFNPKLIPSTTGNSFTGLDYIGCTFDLYYSHFELRLTLTVIGESSKGLQVQFDGETEWKVLDLNKMVRVYRKPFKIRAIK